MYLFIFEAPSLQTCPADFEVNTDAGKPTAMVQYKTPNATDDSNRVSVQCDPPSASKLGMGQTKITCEAIDSCENSAICKFLVDVKGKSKISMFGKNVHQR